MSDALAGRARVVLDAPALRALGVLAAAGGLLGAEHVLAGSRGALDPFAFGAGALGLLLLARFAVTLPMLARRVRALATARRHTLHLSAEALRWEAPGGTLEVAREDVLAVVEAGAWEERGPRRFAEVWLVLRPTRGGEALVALPPVFHATPGATVEHLERWRGARDAPPAPPAASSTLPSALYDAAARGTPAPGTTIVRHGRGWMARGPWAAPVMALAFVRAAGPALSEGTGLGPLPWLGLALCVLLPLGWLTLAWRHVAPRRGLALVATPDALLLRTRAGVLPFPWTRLRGVRVTREPGLPLLAPGRSHLVLDRTGDEAPTRYDEAFLGAPADVVAALLGAYRRGEVPARSRA